MEQWKQRAISKRTLQLGVHLQLKMPRSFRPRSFKKKLIRRLDRKLEQLNQLLFRPRRNCTRLVLQPRKQSGSRRRGQQLSRKLASLFYQKTQSQCLTLKPRLRLLKLRKMGVGVGVGVRKAIRAWYFTFNKLFNVPLYINYYVKIPT